MFRSERDVEKRFDFCVVLCKCLYFITGQLPIVDCSFITEFEDVLLVAMDAEVIMFLHDLITNYVKEKDRGRE